jgi:fructan beta-fructosidase
MPVARPTYHLTPPNGWMNDPNGMLYHNGEYHIFYQWCPTIEVDVKTMHWAHAVSRDLAHWEHLPIALAPDKLGAIWSGSAVTDTNNTSGFFNGATGGIVAIFTHHLNGNERQSLAYSADDGRTWTKYAGNPVLGNEESRDFRDPKVFWHEPTSRWIMIVGCKHRLFASKNLREWTFLSETGYSSECPDMFPLAVEDSKETKWLLSLGGHKYAVGDFDGTRFVPQYGPHPVDGATDFYASQSFDGVPGGRRIWIGWQNNWRYAPRLPDFGARGAMTLTRDLTLRAVHDGGYRLIQKPSPELAVLRGETIAVPGVITPGQRLFSSDSFELECTLNVDPNDRCGLKVRCSANEETLIGYDSIPQQAFIDRERSGNAMLNRRFTAPLDSWGKPVTVRIFVDKSLIEVFFNDGNAVLTSQVLPRDESTGVEWFSENGKSSLAALKAYSL